MSHYVSQERNLCRCVDAKTVCRLLAVWIAIVAGASSQEAHAAVAQQVQSGTAVNSANGIQSIAISGVDPTKSVLFFETRSNSNRPVGSTVRGRLPTACANPCTTIEFERVTDEVTPVAINIQWYVVTFGSGVKVQRGEVAQSLTVVDVLITPVASLSQAFVLFSKTPAAADQTWSQDDAALGELTTTSNLEFRTNAADAAKIIAWQVVEFTNAADINVQKGSITTMTGTTTSVTATLSPAVNVNKTFVLTGWQTPGTGPNIGARMLRAQLTDSSTITIDRGVGNQTIALRNAASAGAVSGNLTINIPAGTVQGDVMIASIGVSATTPTITAPSAAWTLVRQINNTGTRVPSLAVYWAVAGASEPASYTWTISANTGVAGGIHSFSGVDTTTPINIENGQLTSSSLTHATPTVTTTAANTMVVTSHTMASAVTWTQPTGMAKAFDVASITVPPDNASYDSTVGSYVIQAAAGATGTQTATASSNADRGATHILALTPKNDDISEIVWQAIELKDNSTVWRGSANFPSGTAQVTTSLSPNVNTTRAVAFISSQNGNGQSMGRSPYAGDDIIGVASATVALSTSQITLDRNSTVDTADVGWFVVQFDRGSGFKVGSFAKSGAVGTQTIAHGLGEVPKAIILWTDGGTNQSFFTGGYNFGFGMTDGTTSKSVAEASADAGASSDASRRMASKALTIVEWGVVLLAEADLQSWDDTNFTLNWTTNNATAYVIHFMAIGGSDVSAKVVEWTMPTAANPSYPVTGVGFQPNVVIHAHAGDSFTGASGTNAANAAFGLGLMDADGDQWALMNFTPESQNPSDTQRGQQTNAAIYSFNNALAVQKKASWVSMDANGFTMNFTTASISAARVYSLALKGVNVKPGSFLKSTTTATGTATFVQQTAQNPPAAAVHTQTFPGVSTSGNLIVVSLNVGAGASVSSVADSKGNTYTLAAGPTSWNGGQTVATYYASNIIGGGAAITVTVTLSASTSLEFYQLEYSGVSVLDQVSVGTGTSTAAGAMNSGSKTTTYSNELIYGFGMSCGTGTPDASFTTRSTFDSNFVADKSVTTAGTYNVFGTSNCAGWVVDMLTFNVGTSQSITGVGFQPSAVLLTSFQDVTQANPVAQSRLGLGASDGTTQGSSALADQDAVSPTNVDAIDKTSKVFVKDNNATPAIDAEADLVSLGTDGFTLNWSKNDAVATQILYLAFARLDVTEVRLISFNGTRYPRGVLLQWKTGYEINNLGFNLYRERNGVRTRVNSSLVAGSGLLAGSGTAVNAEQSYARWDVDPAAKSDGVVYWLEDLDFNGTSTLHGPITPVAAALSAPEPTVTQSSNLGDLGKRKDRKVFVWHDGDREVRRDLRRGAAPVQSALDTQWALAGQAPVKIGIRQPGWYRVPQVDLVAAGLDPRVDPRRLRLFVDGVEQAMRVTGEAAGRFVAGDTIEFYATGIDTPYTDTRVYWLATGIQPGLRIAVTGSAVGGAVADKRGPASFWSTVRRKDRSIYFAALKNGDKENWFGPLVWTDPTDLVLTADHIDRAAPGPAQLEVTLQGVTINPDVHPDHRVSVLVNGTEVGEMTFDGRVDAVQTFAVPVNVLADGDNTVTLIARGGDADYSLVDVLGLSYWHTYRADADRLRATVDLPGPVTIGGFASPAIRVVDITNPAAATELRGAVRPEAGGFSSVDVRVSGNGPRTLLAFSDATIASPAFVEANHPSSWHASSQAHDYVAISHASFVEQMKPLVDLREQQGHHAAVVDVDDVYDEFSFGEKTPQAIRDFLQSARTTWKQAPRFVVLVGDATIDPRDYAGMGDADFVPTKSVPMTGVALETASDDWFVDFNGDGLPDVPIGRLSVRTVDQAEAVVGKIVRYDQNSLQPWTKDVLLVADQNDDSSNFEQYSTQLSARLPADYTAHQVFRGALGGDVAHQTLIDRVNDGQLLVNYAGHGSVRIWGSDGELLTNEDVTASWRNATRLPFVVAMNCLNGFFYQIWDEESLAEALQRAPQGGAVAVWASSSLTSSATQSLVNQELFRLIFQGAYTTVGEAVAAAKRVVSSPDLRRSWIFFGDPAMHLIGAPQPVSTRSQPSPTPASSTPVTPTGGTHAAADPGQAATTTSASAAATLAARPEPVRLADFNADGRADVLVYAASSGRWAAVFDDAAGINVRAGQWDPAWRVAAADLNGDGRADLVFYKAATGEWVQALTTTTGTSASTRGTLPGGAGPHAQLRVGDFNGDHRDDLLIYDPDTDPDTGAWTVGLSDGRGGFTARRGTWPAGLRVSVADFNGDGLADVVGYDAKTGRGVLALTTRDGQFNVTSADWGPGWRVTVANLDGNASADLLLYNPVNGSWQEAFNDGAGRFATRTGAWGPGLELHATDLDGDGRDDVFAYNPTTGQWLTALNVSPGRFAVTSSVWTTGWLVATGDLNGDGRGDVVLYDPVTGVWFQCITVDPGVFAYASGNWLPGASLVGRPR